MEIINLLHSFKESKEFKNFSKKRVDRINLFKELTYIYYDIKDY